MALMAPAKNTAIAILMCVVISLFLFFELKPSLETPDISADEGLSYSTTVFLMNNVSENPFHWKEVVFFGRHYPLTSNGWNHGALESYLIFPAVKIFGIHLWSLRIIPIFFGVLIIILTYAVGSRLFSPAVGLISSSLLALNPFYITAVKLGPSLGFSLPMFSLIALLSLWKYLKTEKNQFLYLTAFSLGVGLNAKGFFVWFIIGFLLSTLFCYWNVLRRIKYKSIGLTALVFFIGAFPALCFYYSSSVMRIVAHSGAHATYLGHDNLRILENLIVRLKQLRFILGGEKWENLFSINFPVVLFWLSFFYIARLIIFGEMSPEKKQIRHLFLIILFVATTSTFSFTGLWRVHWCILMPYLQFLIAVAMVEIFKLRNSLSRVFVSTCLILLLTCYSNLLILRYHQHSLEKKSSGTCSIGALTRWLIDNKYSEPVSFDPNVHFGLRIFSGLKMCNRETICWPDEKDAREIIYRSLSQPNNGRVFIASYIRPQQKVNVFIQFSLEELKKKMVIVKDFTDPDTGKLRFRVFGVTD